ncbi:MAG: DUF4268 domain-containing protein [Candidatus Sericytochromatia bacterium]|nr:DUF4268 domain-containing protein [Candidatus Sericytochromatia bacterium]
MKAPLGKLERLSLRKAWAHEASDFTPWLALPENLAVLAEALGLDDLELVGTEHPVGDFKIDILCSGDGGKVIIENQLERTNHTHLGQILTYAAGVGASRVIWIAERFRTEHVAALEFLNQHTTEELDFFAVEVELWRIGDSPMAPAFKPVVRPNDWAKVGQQSARLASSMTTTKQLQLRFWAEWAEWLKAKGSKLRPNKGRPQAWLIIPLGRSGIWLAAVLGVRDKLISMEVYIDDADPKESFRRLKEHKQAIEEQLGMALEWQELPDKRASRIRVQRKNSPVDPHEAWPECFAWLEQTGVAMDRVFRPLLKELD